MRKDYKNGIELTYNPLNLIENILQNGNSIAKYMYLADGTKLSATDAEGNGLVYAGSLVYKKTGNTVSLESSAFKGGRIIATANTFEPRYFITDHLGSVRTILDRTGAVTERNDYHPYGYRWLNAQQPTSENRYRYNGKEEQGFINLPYIDYGARQYDPKNRLQWNGSDVFAGKYPEVNPFVFCLGNPVRYIDPDGREIQVHDYTNNQRTTYEWRQYEGQWGFYDSNKILYAGTDTFIGQLSGALTGLMKGGKTGFDLVTNLSEMNDIISIGKGRNVYDEYNQAVGWNPSGGANVPTSNGADANIPFVSLGHELAHAWDYTQGTANSKTWIRGTAYGTKDIPKSEIYSTHMENRIRAENGLQLRTHYLVTTAGTGAGPRIIDANGRSTYFNINNTTNYKPISSKKRFPY